MLAYDFTVKNIDGSEKNLLDYKGKVLLIVNTATKCGLTPQYEGLQKLYEKYADKGFEILDFPCNQFLDQAPGSDKEIHAFCTGRFGVTFPQFAKIDVNGKNESPLYTWLKKHGGGMIKWNFAKFLVDREGNVVARFAPTKSPKAIDEKIAALL